MDIFKKVLVGIYLAVSAILILVVTFQSKDSENSAEDTYENAQYNKFFDKNKGRTKKGAAFRNTLIVAILYTVLTIATGIVYIIY